MVVTSFLINFIDKGREEINEWGIWNLKKKKKKKKMFKWMLNQTEMKTC